MNKAFLKENIIILTILCIVFIICFYDVVFFNKTFKLTTGNSQALITGPYGQENNRPEYFPVHSTDVPVFEEPFTQFIKTSFWNGIYPLWNPYQACGIPFVGMMQTGILFPLNALSYFLPNTLSFDFLVFFRLLLSGLFTYWFMRTLKFKKIPSLGSAIAFMISAPMIFIHWTFVNVEILLPLLLIMIERLLRKPCLIRSIFLAIVVALVCFAGHAEHIVLVNCYALVFFVFRAFSTSTIKNTAKTFGFFVLAYIWGVCAAAVIVLPFLQNWMSQFWHAHSEFIGAVAEGWNNRTNTLINFVMPSFFQKEIVTLDFERSTFWGHIGIIPLGLAVLSLFKRQKQGLNYFFALMAAFLFTKSFINFPLTNLIGYLPVLRNCRFNHHSQHMFFFSIAVLVGMGIRWALANKKRFYFGLVYGIPLTAIMGITLYCYRNAPHFNLSLQSFLFALAILAVFLCVLFLKDRGIFNTKIFTVILIGILAAELFLYIPRRGRVNRFDSFPKVPYMEFLKSQQKSSEGGRIRSYGMYWTFHPNTASGYAMDDFGIVENLMLKRYVRFINEFIFPDYFNKEKTTTAFWVIPATFIPDARPYFNLLNVKYTIGPTDIKRFFPPAKGPGFQTPLYSKEVNIYAHTNALPRAFVVHKAVFEPDEVKSFERMKKLKAAFRNIVLINADPDPDIQDSLLGTPFESGSSAIITDYGINQVTVKADMTHPGFLVLSDSYHPDWKAYVDGKSTKIYLADTFIRAVFLPKGEHVITFRFEPLSFTIGLVVSCVTIILLISMGVLAQQKKKKS